MFSSVLCYSFAESITKLLYIRNPDIEIIEFIFFRFLTQFVMIFALTNIKTKIILWDTVPRRLIPALVIIVACGLASFLCLYTAIKYLPMLIIALVGNTLPLFTALFSFLILKERIRLLEIITLIVAFIGVFILLFDNKEV